MRAIAWAALSAVALSLAGCGGSSGPRGGPGPLRAIDPAEAEFTAIRMLLAHYPKLRFDGEQKARLQEIQARLVARNRALAERVREIMRERRTEGRADGDAPRRGRPPEGRRERMEEAREAVRPLLERMRENEEEAIRNALAVFRDPQREIAKKLIEEYRAQSRTERRRGRDGARSY